ncbi:hypothetical protein D3C72_1410400 [compost metagenome]
MHAVGLGLGDAAFQRQVQSAHPPDAAFGEFGLALVRQHMLDPQHRPVFAP